MNNTKNKKIEQHNRSINDKWKQYKNNPHIQQNILTKEFRCITCHQNLSSNQGAAGKHSKTQHNLALNGIHGKNKTSDYNYSNEKPVIQQSLNNIDSEIKKREKIENREINVESPESIILHDIYRDIAKSASKLGRDAELLYEYQQLKSRYLIPADWDYYLWLKKCVLLYNYTFKIQMQFIQDTEHLPEHLLKWQKDTILENMELNRNKNQEQFEPN